jgi:hypothetical protein
VNAIFCGNQTTTTTTTVAPPTTTGNTTTTTTGNSTSTTTAASTSALATTTSTSTLTQCLGCFDALQDQIGDALKKGGGVGLGFSFLEVVSVFFLIYSTIAQHPPSSGAQIGGVVMAFLFWRQTNTASPNYRAFL